MEEEKKVEEAGNEANTPGSVENEGSKVSQEDIDARIIEAFFRCLHDSLTNDLLPIEPSDLQKNHLSLYTASTVDGSYTLDFRLSSFKRIGKLLEIMHKRGVIEYSEVKGLGHKLVTRICRDSPEVKDFVPKYSLKRVSGAGKKNEGESGGFGGEDIGYPKVQIEEIYEPTKHMNCVLG